MGDSQVWFHLKCSDIWDYISRDKHAWIFSHPINTELLGIMPDYHSIILEPMDLSTVKAKLKSGEIVSPEEFERNMKLIFQNAMCYHPPGHDVHTMAQHLLNKLEAKCDAMQWKEDEDSGFVLASKLRRTHQKVLAGAESVRAHLKKAHKTHDTELARLQGNKLEGLTRAELTNLLETQEAIATDGRRRVQEELLRPDAMKVIADGNPSFMCPITQELMDDPVMAADNFTYERAAIINWIKRRGSQGQVATSPETNVPLANNNLRPNTTLKKAIKEAIQKKINEAMRNRGEGVVDKRQRTDL